jgi:hypothetical protein
VRSSHSHTSYKWGHQWLTLAIVVKFPWTARPWALPVLAVLYRPQKINRAEGRRHKTPAELARQMLAAMMHWFPARKFVLLGDGGYATLDLAHFCARHDAHLVSRLRADAALYAPPPAKKKGEKGRPRVKGRAKQIRGSIRKILNLRGPPRPCAFKFGDGQRMLGIKQVGSERVLDVAIVPRVFCGWPKRRRSRAAKCAVNFATCFLRMPLSQSLLLCSPCPSTKKLEGLPREPRFPWRDRGNLLRGIGVRARYRPDIHPRANTGFHILDIYRSCFRSNHIHS